MEECKYKNKTRDGLYLLVFISLIINICSYEKLNKINNKLDVLPKKDSTGILSDSTVKFDTTSFLRPCTGELKPTTFVHDTSKTNFK